jgi:hypothetical protein
MAGVVVVVVVEGRDRGFKGSTARVCQPRVVAPWHSPAQRSAAQHSTAQHSTAQYSTAQHSTAQHSTAQHSTAQHSTAQHQALETSVPTVIVTLEKNFELATLRLTCVNRSRAICVASALALSRLALRASRTAASSGEDWDSTAASLQTHGRDQDVTRV